MYVDKCIVRANGKSYTRYLLRESRREGKKTIKTTILNITPWGETTCEAIRFALKNQHRLGELDRPNGTVETPQLTQEHRIGDVWLLYQIAQKYGLVDALGDTTQARLALWQILARIIDQGSRLSAVRLAKARETGFLRLGTFTEYDLYKNLDWIAGNQTRIKNFLYKKHHNDQPCKLFLYDVTSSYFEGVQNELANFGYNRDKKQGKMQIVVGLLCNNKGCPVSIEVFEGNTNDTKTLHNQVRKAADRFRAENVVFVGDRGMIKSAQQKQLRDEDFDFITALTRPQIETLIKQDTIQQSFFDETLHEIVLDDARYILKRNPVRAEEIKANRYSKLLRLKQLIAERNTYLHEHSKAKTASSFKRTESRAKRLKIDSWTELTVGEEKRTIGVTIDEEKLEEVSRLDGCYCLTTSLGTETMSKEDVHSRYKDLAMVENAFRTCITGHLEMRPIYVRKAGRTRAHVFVVMLSHLLIRELREDWHGVDRTVEESLDDLSSLCGVRVQCKGVEGIYTIPRPRAELQRLFDLCGITPPVILPAGQSHADTNQKLPCRRKSK